MRFLWIVTVLLALISVNVDAQTDLEKAFQKKYEENIQKTRINGVYIPVDLNEAYEELAALSTTEGVDKFKNAPEEVIASKLHFGLGRWISYNWNLEEGSRYEAYLKSIGLKDIDHMMQFTIVSWHRHLNNRPLEIDERVAAYDKEIEERLKEWRERSEVLDTYEKPKE